MRPMPLASPPPQQLDIFEHSADVMLRNDAIDALLRREPAAARAAADKLAGAFPDDAHLPAIHQLAGSLARQGAAAPLTHHDALAVDRDHLQDVIAPAATAAFGSRNAARYLQAEWRELAARCGGLSFDASRPEDHAAPLWLRAEAWGEAASAAERIESWRRIPAPLAWMAEARCRLGALDGCWPLLAELAWLAPRRLDGLLRHRAPDRLLLRLATAFGARFEGSGDARDLAWFPAWVLTETPALAERLSPAWPSQDSPPERGMRLLIELLGLERQGRHSAVVEQRRALRELSPPLYDAYMKTR